MFIQTEPTPNPEVLKFIPGQPVSPSGPHEFRSAEEAAQSPLAVALFEIEGVTRVFFGSDFLTVTKAADREWKHLKAPVLAAISPAAPIMSRVSLPVIRPSSLGTIWSRAPRMRI